MYAKLVKAFSFSFLFRLSCYIHIKKYKNLCGYASWRAHLINVKVQACYVESSLYPCRGIPCVKSYTWSAEFTHLCGALLQTADGWQPMQPLRLKQIRNLIFVTQHWIQCEQLEKPESCDMLYTHCCILLLRGTINQHRMVCYLVRTVSTSTADTYVLLKT